jgi:hypothetical protein
MKLPTGIVTLFFKYSLIIVIAFGMIGGSAVRAQTTAASNTTIDYFKGTWTVSIKGDTAGDFRWELAEALDGSWLNGRVERGGKGISDDHWRQSDSAIDRFAFTAGKLFVRLTSRGWDHDNLVFTGAADNDTGKFMVRETITRLSADKFHALWERKGKDGKWTTFSDETCVRQARA